MGNRFEIRLGDGIALPEPLLQQLAAVVQKALAELGRPDSDLVVVHIEARTSMFQGHCYGVRAVVHRASGDEWTQGITVPLEPEVLLYAVGEELKQLAPAVRAAIEQKANDPKQRAMMALTAAMNADRAFLLRYGEDEAQQGAATGDIDRITTGAELCAIGGEPMRTAPILMQALAQLSTGDARSLRLMIGGLRVWNSLGHARLIGNLAWLFRESAKIVSPDIAVRKSIPFEHIHRVLNRLGHLGMARLDPDRDQALGELVRGTPWRALQDRFGTNLAKFCMLVRTVSEREWDGKPDEDPTSFAVALRIELETLVGKTLGPMTVPPPSELAQALKKRPEALDPMLLDDASRSMADAFSKRDFPAAINVASQALFARPGDAELTEMLAVAMTQSGQPNERTFKLLVPLLNHRPSPGWTDCLAMVTGLLVDNNQPKAALQSADAALAFDPFHPRARMFRALAKKRLGDIAGAQEDASLARLVHAEDPGVQGFLRNIGF